MKILLIHPNKFAHRYASVGIAMISAVLKKAGHEVLFFDTSRFQDYTKSKTVNNSEKSISKMQDALQFLPVNMPVIKKSKEMVLPALCSRIKSFKPDLIGISATSSEFPFSVKIAGAIKKYRIPTIIGGIHSTVAPLDVLKVEGVDMAMIGEGEDAILELTKTMESGRKQTDIRNIYFKSANRIIKNDVRPYIKNLDTLPFMDLDIFDKYHHIGAYQGRLVTYARLETARGCPYKCTYCINELLHDKVYSREKNHLRYKSPRRAIDELKHIDSKIKFDIVRFTDESFTACSLERLEEFVQLYRKEINKPMVIATRPETITKQKVDIIRRASDNIQVTMGIESGSPRIRTRILNRRISDKTIINAFKLCNEAGISTAAFNMIGLPKETRKDFFKTIELNAAARVNTPILSYFYPFIGSSLRDLCVKKGYVPDKCQEIDYSVSNVLKLPDFSKKAIQGLRKTFVLYVKMGKRFYADIRKAESDDRIFKNLAGILTAETKRQ